MLYERVLEWNRSSIFVHISIMNPRWDMGTVRRKNPWKWWDKLINYLWTQDFITSMKGINYSGSLNSKRNIKNTNLYTTYVSTIYIYIYCPKPTYMMPTRPTRFQGNQENSLNNMKGNSPKLALTNHCVLALSDHRIRAPKLESMRCPVRWNPFVKRIPIGTCVYKILNIYTYRELDHPPFSD